jgi:hypothetical protein
VVYDNDLNPFRCIIGVGHTATDVDIDLLRLSVIVNR